MRGRKIPDEVSMRTDVNGPSQCSLTASHRLHLNRQVALSRLDNFTTHFILSGVPRTNRSQIVVQLISVCITQEFSKRQSRSPSKSSSHNPNRILAMEKGRAVNDPSFPKFRNLAKEIRLEIWEAALPGPRIVELRERPFKIENLLNRSHLTPMTSFKSYCRALDVLFACREPREVAVKHYERAFDMAASHLGTWFDFHRDVLYICWDKFNFNHATEQFNDLIYYIPCIFDEEIRERIENLAILMNKKAIRNYGEKNLEEFLSCILGHFHGVKTLSLVAKHVSDYPGSETDRNRMELSLLDPIDTDCLELCYRWGSEHSWRHKMQFDHGISIMVFLNSISIGSRST
jgi:hypothetical protein